MIKLIIILACFSGMPRNSEAASVFNLALLRPEQDKDHSGAPKKRQQFEDQHETGNSLTGKKTDSLAAQQEQPDMNQILNGNPTGAFFLFGNNAGNFDLGFFEEQVQEIAGRDTWLQIKTSLKKANNEWSRIDNWVSRLFLDDNNSPNLASISSEQLGLLVTTGTDSAKALQKSLSGVSDPLSDDDSRPYQGPAVVDPSILSQIMFYLSLPGLIKLLSENVAALIVIMVVFCLWLSIKGVIKFYKRKARKKRKIRKDRTIDGVMRN